jgi:hypothetical protein
MRFRLKAFGLHLLASAIVLALVLSGLYLGWYHWPGWYLTDVVPVAAILVGVDLTLGPLLTVMIANPGKPRRALTRDIAMIVVVQLAALAYGATTLWSGRPLYYAFCNDRIEIVQASGLQAAEIALAQKENPEFVPHWYSVPRWIWLPLPADANERARIAMEALTGSGPDLNQRPKYFKPWEQGLPSLRKQLKTVDQLGIFSKGQQQTLKGRMARLGLPTDQSSTLLLTGKTMQALAVFDPRTLQLESILSVD